MDRLRSFKDQDFKSEINPARLQLEELKRTIGAMATYSTDGEINVENRQEALLLIEFCS